MGIIKRLSYSITCDNCNRIYENPYTGITVFLSDENAIELALDDNWSICIDKYYCPKCSNSDINENANMSTNILEKSK